VTNKSLTSNKATIYTSANHGFSAGQTVVISGVDEIFDGSYEILGGVDSPTDKTFKYERTFGSNISDEFVTPIARLASSSSTTDVVITAASIPATNQVTFTTSTQAYVAGDRVTVIGVSTELDGTYEVLASPAPSSTSFSVARISKIAPSTTIINTTSNPTSATKPTSSIAKARVPFAIKVSSGTVGGAAGTLPAGRNLELASVTVTGTSVTRQDLRQFTAGTGGIRLYNSSLPNTTYDPDGSVGGARYDIATNKFELYSTAGDDKWQPIFYGTTLHHDSRATDSSNAAIHHTIGTGQFNAAKGNHVHAISSTRLGLNNSLDNSFSIFGGAERRVDSRNSAAPTVLSQSGAMDIPANTVVLVVATASVIVDATSTKCNFGIKLNTGTIQRTSALGSTDGIFSVTSIRRYLFSSAANNVIFQFAAYRDTSAGTADVYRVFDADMMVIPFSTITTNTLS
jgi:hypothetical protein